MSNNYWGSITWEFLHVNAEKIKDSEYQNEKAQILKNIKNICSNLPCPECKKHAGEFMKRVTVQHIKEKVDLQNLLFNFHNEVNIRTNKKKVDKEVLSKYSKYNFKDLLQNFFYIFSKPVHSNRLMMDSLNRNFFMKELLNYYKNNINKYNN